MDKALINDIPKSIAIICLLSINFLFSYKYLNRVTDFSLIISLALSLFYWALLSNKVKLKLTEKILKYLQYSFVVIFFIVSSIVFIKVDVHSLNVDRWSVISSFWETTFNGEYSYFAISHMGNKPGPMPIYFLLALPFYLINELGYFSLLGLIVLIYLIAKINSSNNYKLLILVFMTTSTFYLWEVITRSNIFTTTILVLCFLFSFSYQKKNSGFKFYLSAILAGFLLSTRAVFIIPYIIFFMHYLIKKEISTHQISIYASIAFLAFASTFLPFLLAFPDKFFEMNPFIIQSSFLVPTYYTFIFIIMAFIFSFFSKNKTDLFFYSGLVLFISILIYCIYNIGLIGFGGFYTGERVDISYFIFCIPFFIMYLLKIDLAKKLPL